jgi:hypothetical protein
VAAALALRPCIAFLLLFVREHLPAQVPISGAAACLLPCRYTVIWEFWVPPTDFRSVLYTGSVPDATQKLQGGGSSASIPSPAVQEAVVDSKRSRVFSDSTKPHVWDTQMGMEVTPWILKRSDVAGPVTQHDVFQGIPFLDENNPAFLDLVEVCLTLRDCCACDFSSRHSYMELWCQSLPVNGSDPVNASLQDCMDSTVTCCMECARRSVSELMRNEV